MSKVTFYGLPAWVGAIHGPTACELWTQDPAQLHWDRAQLIPVDLANTTSAAQAGRIQVAQIEVDDHASHGGRTTIGPRWPGGAQIGACWFAEHHLAKVRHQLASIGPSAAVPSGGSGHHHEYTMVQYFDGEQGNRRFYGLQANLVQSHGPLSLVELWHPGSGAGTAKPAGQWWLDLGAHADPTAAPLAAGKPAPLFLDATAAQQIALIGPKVPPFTGAFAFAPARRPLDARAP
jgi:hypothetical protein